MKMMKELLKLGATKGIVVGAAIVTASAVVTVAAIPKKLCWFGLEVAARAHQENKKPKVEQIEEQV